MKKIIILFFILISYGYLLSQEIKINQKEGIFQDKKENYITFHRFKKFQIDLNKVVLSRVTKVIIYNDKVFILDERQSRIFVFDKLANYLYSIGRPGQGPGDLEYPRDFIISKEGNIYVVNSMAKRIEVFSLKGDFQKRIKMNLPPEIFYSRPTRILVGPDQYFFIAYGLSSHLIDIYDPLGNYQSNVIKRAEPIFIPGQNMGNSSQISLFQKDNTLLHFNNFTGIFTKITQKGRVKKVFSAFDEFHQEKVSRSKKSMKERRKEMKPGIRIRTFVDWSNYCVDEDYNIYIFLLWKKKGELQKMFAFSPDGTLLYCTTIPYFKDTRIDNIFCFGDQFVFVTLEQEIFFSMKASGATLGSCGFLK